MRLLFDHNLSHKLVRRLVDAFPDSTQTRLANLATAPDATIWDYAGQHGLILVTLDADFADLSLLRGHPPKVIWLRCGNSTVGDVERLLRLHQPQIESFAQDPVTSCLEIWG
jgi:predicted nuclease of predicted toxin-antitoxin system